MTLLNALRALLISSALVLTSAAQAQQTQPQTQPQQAQPLQTQSRQARAQREQLQAAIQALHKKITATENARQEVVLQLRVSEQAISRHARVLAELNAQQRRLVREIAALERQIAAQKQTLLVHQQALGRQLQTRYMKNTAAGATAFWSVVLSGGQPHAVGRELAYLSYVSQAQADNVRSVRQGLEKLAATEADLRTRQQQQSALVAQAAQQKKALERQYFERERVLLRISAQLREQRTQVDGLKRDEQRLNELVKGLEAALLEQAQIARQAARQATRQAEEQARRAAGANQTPPARTPPQRGLQKGLPWPVNGQVQGRFGAARPDGGVWRGIVLLADEGTPVQAIAPGQVVYADWLKGFGNMVILDHGQDWMSIYAYNQSLLKSVGDAVTTGDALATVGATGGQVQAGLYFEIRQQGVPVNPLLWLGR